MATDPTTEHSAVVRFVGPELRAGTRELVAEAFYDNGAGRLRAGMFATARLEIGRRTAVVVPAAAVRRRGSSWRAFVVRDGRVEERVVEPDGRVGDTVAIVAGVRAGERVVAAAGPEIEDGLRAE